MLWKSHYVFGIPGRVFVELIKIKKLNDLSYIGSNVPQMFKNGLVFQQQFPALSF